MLHRTFCNKFTGFLLVLFLSTTVFTSALAQTGERLIISFIETQPQGQATLLRILFSMTGDLGRQQVELAEIVLDGEAISAETNPSDSPFYIALALDFSGSMSDSVLDMRDAAIRAVNNAPRNAQITIIRFNATVNATPFLTREEAIEELLSIQQDDANGGTKLYDATYTAVEDVQRIAGGTESQRAVIVFTDGNDVENIDDTEQFSEHSFQDVIDLAKTPKREVPIYTIGLGDNVDPNLPTMSSETRGQHVAENSGTTLGRAFEQIMSSLGRPWLAQALICTTSGEKNAFLRVTTVQGEVIEAPIQFTVDNDCNSVAPEPAVTQQIEPSQIELLQLRLREMLIDETLFLNGRFIKENDQFVRRYAWQLKDVNNPVPIPLDNALFIFSDTDDTFRYPLEGIELQDTQYELWVDAFDANNNLLDNTRSERFQYTPPESTAPSWERILIGLLILLLLLLLLYLLWLWLAKRRKKDPVPSPINTTVLAEEAFAPVVAFAPNPTTTLRVNQSPGWPEPYEVLYINNWPFTIGRENCDLSLEGDWRVSRTHCQIGYHEGQFFIEDFGSSNGTIVNGQAIEPGVEVPLYPQSIIELGRDTILEFEP